MTLNLDKKAWRKVAFGDVVKNLNITVRDPSADGIDRIIAMEHLDPGELKVARSGALADGTTFTRRVRPGQTLFGKRRAYQRKAAFAEFDAVCSGDILVLEASPDQLVPELLPFLVQSNGFYDHALGTSAGSLSPRTNWRELATYEFDLPPLDEQRGLANLLWGLERHRENLAAEAAMVRTAIDLLSIKFLRQPGQLMRVDQAGQVLMGRQRSPQHATGDHMVDYLRVANVGDGALRLDDVKQMNFTPVEQQRYGLRVGDILISEGQSRELVGQSAVIRNLDRTTCFQNTLIRFRAIPEMVRVDYAQALFRACLLSGIFAEIATQTTSIAHLGVSRFGALQVPVPPLEEQDRRLEVLESAQLAERAVTDELERLSALRASISAVVFGD